jgi:hypothetical protein
MRDPAILAARHPRPSGKTCTQWALELVVLIHAGKKSSRRPLRRSTALSALSPDSLAELRGRNIAACLENYGNDWSRFESALSAKPANVRCRHPLVSVPTSAVVDWKRGSLHIRSQTFLVSHEQDEPVFLTREPRSRKVLKMSLAQMRLLHRTWQQWPAVMPSMLLNVLWHWPLGEQPLP